MNKTRYYETHMLEICGENGRKIIFKDTLGGLSVYYWECGDKYEITNIFIFKEEYSKLSKFFKELSK